MTTELRTYLFFGNVKSWKSIYSDADIIAALAMLEASKLHKFIIEVHPTTGTINLLIADETLVAYTTLKEIKKKFKPKELWITYHAPSATTPTAFHGTKITLSWK